MSESIIVTPDSADVRAEKYCKEFNLRTQAEAEQALNNVDTLYRQSSRFYGDYGADPELDVYYNQLDADFAAQDFKKTAQHAVEKFKNGEFPKPEWDEEEKKEEDTHPKPNDALPVKARDDSPTGSGNTPGKVVVQAAPAAKPPEEANAAVTAETAQEKGWLDQAGEWWDETKKDVTKWGEEAGEKLSAAWDNPGKAAIGAGKEAWNTLPDMGELAIRVGTGLPSAVMSDTGNLLKWMGADAIGDTALAAADKWNKEVVDKVVEFSHVDAARFDITDKAEQGGALGFNIASLATGVGGLLKQGAKTVAKKVKPPSGGKVKGQSGDTPDAKPAKETPKDDATPSNNKEGSCNGTCGKVGEPVDVATGDFLQEWPVIVIPGLLPITLTRTYRSAAKLSGLFGEKWADDWSRQLVIGSGEVLFTDADGVVYDFATPQNQVLARNKHIPHCVLTGEITGELCLTDRRAQLTYHFNPVAGTLRQLSAITDRRQNRIAFLYDKQSRLVAVTRNDGLRLSLHYQDGQLHALDLHETREGQAVRQRLLTCQYDPQGYLSECDAFQHHHLWHEYDAQGRMTRWHDTDQTDFYLTYDERGRVLSTTSPSGYWCDRFHYDDNARITTYLDGEGGETRYHYDPNGLVIREVDPLGRITRRQWRYSQIVWEADPAGQMTTFGYNP
ncbi:RHS repeat protein, partial [Xenorhabdus sp. 18]|uniref:DUF6531 domain-containing protein n=1 Tax=Xenorhabdus doucetiae TaxID=351671 RepID=UPI00199C2B22